ncbi:MAG: zf-HC2 domain-containing protein [Actinomycetota bacterium]|nr:zf-HC2 domain-containing protein [Actinomycetota bacterium]
MSDAKDLTCRDVVELVTDYLEGTMPAADRARFEEHLMGCEGCGFYLDQVRTTIRVTGSIDEDSIPADQLEILTRAFRTWNRP